MLVINVEKQLAEKRNSSIGSETLKEALLLLEGRVEEERSLLKEAGLDFNIKQLETEAGINMARKSLEEKMVNNIFTEEEIKDICFRFKLRFLPSKMYKGKIDPVLGSKIASFFKEKNIDGGKFEASSNLYIMAPDKAFNLSARPKPVNVDPVLFFKIRTTEGDMYSIIHKWGNDFTVYRRLLGVIYESQLNWIIANSLLAFFAVISIFAVCGMNPFNWISLLVGAAAATLSTMIRIGISVDYRGGVNAYRNKFTENNWNSQYRD